MFPVFDLLLAASFSLSALLLPAAEQQARVPDQEAAFRLTREGKIMALPMIEHRVVPRMRGASYIGAELIDVADRVYRLKFIRDRDARVIWIDVDARTGRILDKSGD